MGAAGSLLAGFIGCRLKLGALLQPAFEVDSAGAQLGSAPGLQGVGTAAGKLPELLTAPQPRAPERETSSNGGRSSKDLCHSCPLRKGFRYCSPAECDSPPRPSPSLSGSNLGCEPGLWALVFPPEAGAKAPCHLPPKRAIECSRLTGGTLSGHLEAGVRAGHL